LVYKSIKITFFNHIKRDFGLSLPKSFYLNNSMKILVFDNYDSFTYNLVQMVEQIVGKEFVYVFKNDEISLEEVEKYDKIILSPGPGVPSEAGILLDVIKEFAPKKPILGVCLGLQAIAEAFGGKLINLNNVYHGVGISTAIIEDNAKIFRGLPSEIITGRYHSWAVDSHDFPEELQITAVDEQGIIMALQHRKYDVHAVQFHPESVLTPCGEKILENFLKD
jgi:hypothetical protein